jgi:hypothetical protein
MKRLLLIFGVVVAIAASFTATASALTVGQALTESEQYALKHFSGGPYAFSCNASGKNKAGESQWYCWGFFEHKTGEWKINVGPYPNEILYAKE